MKFKDQDICGFAASATKSGLNVFYSFNLQQGEEEIDSFLSDVRGKIPVSGTDIEFFSISHNADCACLSIYRTIYDWVGRLGYYSFSLFLPNGKILADGKSLELLKLFSDHYRNYYIDSSLQVKKNVVEDLKPLEVIISDPEYQLKGVQTARSTWGTDQCALKYSNSEELAYILDHHDRSELQPYKMIFVLDARQQALGCNVKVLPPLPPVDKKFAIKFSIIDEDNLPLKDAIITVSKNSESIFYKRKLQDPVFSIEDLKKTDKLNITVEVASYKTTTIPAEKINLWLNIKFGDQKSEYDYAIVLHKLAPPPELKSGESISSSGSMSEIKNLVAAPGKDEKAINKIIEKDTKVQQSVNSPSPINDEGATTITDKGQGKNSLVKIIRLKIQDIPPLYRAILVVFIIAIGVSFFFILWQKPQHELKPPAPEIVDTSKYNDTAVKKAKKEEQGEVDKPTKQEESGKSNKTKASKTVKHIDKHNEAESQTDHKTELPSNPVDLIKKVKNYLSNGGFNKKATQDLLNQITRFNADSHNQDLNAWGDKVNDYIDFCDRYNEVKNITAENVNGPNKAQLQFYWEQFIDKDVSKLSSKEDREKWKSLKDKLKKLYSNQQ